MSDNRNEIAARLRGARDAAGFTVESAAEALKLEPEVYAAIEAGTRDLPMGLLPQIGTLFGIESSAILTGGDSHARVFAVTRRGKGAVVERRKAYHYEHLAARFNGPRMEPFLVTVAPKPGEPFSLNTHDGQEFNLVVGGTLELMSNGNLLVLEEGDSVYFDATRPHGMRARGDRPARFIAIITA